MESSARTIQVSTALMGLVSPDSTSQAKLVEQGEDDNGYDNVSYHSMDAVEDQIPEQKEDKPKPKRLISIKPKLDEVRSGFNLMSRFPIIYTNVHFFSCAFIMHTCVYLCILSSHFYLT